MPGDDDDGDTYWFVGCPEFENNEYDWGDTPVLGENERDGVEGGVGRGVGFVSMTVGYRDCWGCGEVCGDWFVVGLATPTVSRLVLTLKEAVVAEDDDEDDEVNDNGACEELGSEGRGVDILVAGDRVRVGEVGARGVAAPECDSTSG